jgi:hypothetical protein
MSPLQSVLRSDRYTWIKSPSGVTIKDKETGKTKVLGVMPGVPIDSIRTHMNSLTDDQFKDWLKK